MTLDKGGVWLMVCYVPLSGKHFVAFCNGYNTTRFWNLTNNVLIVQGTLYSPNTAPNIVQGLTFHIMIWQPSIDRVPVSAS